MEELELFSVDENGQVFINFESLLLVTDELFVDIIASKILRVEKTIKPKVSYHFDDDLIIINIADDNVVSTYVYHLKRKKFDTTHVPVYLIKEVL